jgi:predicted class III extradiol MEMO1 family dioxygenase
LLDETTYNNTLYAANYDANDTENLNGYFLRIKEINKQFNEKNEEWIKVSSDLTHYKAQLASAEAKHEAAISGIEDVRERFAQ